MVVGGRVGPQLPHIGQQTPAQGEEVALPEAPPGENTVPQVCSTRSVLQVCTTAYAGKITKLSINLG